MDERLRALAHTTAGFMPDDEGDALYRAARQGSAHGPLLEIGSWRGKSAVYLGAAAREADTVAFCVDHHRGSEELQAGWPHHDPAVVDARTGRVDTLPFLRRTLEEAGLEEAVVAVVGASQVVAAHWGTPLGLVFIDGGHGHAAAHGDYDGWSPHVAIGGLLAIHDVFADPAQGGRAPFEIYRRAMVSGRFVEQGDLGCRSLRVLRRDAP